MSEQTGQAVSAGLIELLRHVSEKHEDCDLCVALHANPFAIALDAYIARERKEAVAALGCQRRVQHAGSTCRERMLLLAKIGCPQGTDWLCAPCRAQAELDKEAEMSERTGA